jgi:chromosome segregation ATPase
MLRKILAGRSIKAERKSGLKHDNTIFREKSDSFVTATVHQPEIQTALTTALSEDSESMISVHNATTELFEIGYDTEMIQELASAQETAELTVVVEELEGLYEGQLAEKDTMINQTVEELNQSRQEFLEVIVDMSAMEQELSTTKERLARADLELTNSKIALLETKATLKNVGVSLIKHQHKLYEMEQQMTAMRHIIDFGNNLVGFFRK